MIDRSALASMKPTAALINVARGGIVDTEALVEALAADRLRGAGLDVFEQEPLDAAHPLLHLPTVVVTPHTAGATAETSKRRAGAVAANIDRLERGLPPLHQVTQ